MVELSVPHSLQLLILRADISLLYCSRSLTCKSWAQKTQEFRAATDHDLQTSQLEQ